MAAPKHLKRAGFFLQCVLALILLASDALPAAAEAARPWTPSPASRPDSGADLDSRDPFFWTRGGDFEADPAVRAYHSTIWTGTEMIVWGGQGPNGPTNTGLRYNPATGAWRPLSTVRAPEPRYQHSTVWTGSGPTGTGEMIVWGGRNLSGVLNSGGRYNPATDTWTPISLTNAPEARTDHTAVWTGTEMIVWGGKNLSDFLNSGGRYNPATDTWTPIASPQKTDARAEHSAVWTGSGGTGEMILWGGTDFWDYVNTGLRYNPGTGAWTSTALTNAPAGRGQHIAVWSGSEMLIWGGQDTYGGVTNGGRYNPANDTWTAMSTEGDPRGPAYPAATWTGSELLIWGGRERTTTIGLNTGASYNPITDTWTPIPTSSAPIGRYAHSAVWTGSGPGGTGEMIVWGGIGGRNDKGYLSSGGRYNPSTGAWTPITTTNAPEARFRHSAVWTGSGPDGTGEMIVWGGESFFTVVNSGKRYNPSTDTWAPTSTRNAPSPRSEHSAVWTGSGPGGTGEMIVWGGRDGYSYFNTGGRYNPTTDTWTPMSTTGAPIGRSNHNAVWTGTEMIIWGGINFDDTARVGGRYNPATDTWRPISATNAPYMKEFFTAVWTGSGPGGTGEMLVWGGLGGTVSGSGGRYNPTSDTWTPISTINAPDARYHHSAVWTGTEMIVWGGRGYQNASRLAYNTGGRYNPVTDTWTPMSTINAPDARNTHSAVWTGSGPTGTGEMIVWGGANSSNYMNTGGRYDPASDTWTPMSTTDAPDPHSSHTAVWTGTDMLVWGGASAAGILDTGGRYHMTSDPPPLVSNPVYLPILSAP